MGKWVDRLLFLSDPALGSERVRIGKVVLVLGHDIIAPDDQGSLGDLIPADHLVFLEETDPGASCGETPKDVYIKVLKRFLTTSLIMVDTRLMLSLMQALRYVSPATCLASSLEPKLMISVRSFSWTM